MGVNKTYSLFYPNSYTQNSNTNSLMTHETQWKKPQEKENARQIPFQMTLSRAYYLFSCTFPDPMALHCGKISIDEFLFNAQTVATLCINIFNTCKSFFMAPKTKQNKIHRSGFNTMKYPLRFEFLSLCMSFARAFVLC